MTEHLNTCALLLSHTYTTALLQINLVRAGKIFLFALSICLGLLSSYIGYLMVTEVNRRVPEIEKVSLLRGFFVIFVVHRRVCPASRLRILALACLLATFILFILSADAVL